MSRRVKDECLIPGGLRNSPKVRAKGVSDGAIRITQKSAEAIVVVLGNEGRNQSQGHGITKPHGQKEEDKGLGRPDSDAV